MWPGWNGDPASSSTAALHGWRSRFGWLFAASALGFLGLAYGAWAWSLVFAQRIGPVIAVVDASGGRGVHSGDLLSLPLILCSVVSLVAASVCLVRAQGGWFGMRRPMAPLAATVPVIRIAPVLPTR